MEFRWRALDARVIQMGEKIEVSRAGPRWEGIESEREGEGRGREKRGKGKERRRILVNTVHSVPYLVSTVSAKDYSIIQIL